MENVSTDAVVLNPVEVTDDLRKAIQESLNPSDIREAILSEAEKQTAALVESKAAEKAAADKAAADAAAAKDAVDAAAAGGQTFTRTETIGGRQFTFEAESELELERLVSNAFRVAEAVTTETPANLDTAAAQEAARVAAEVQAASKAELELKFKRGDISAADYIEQSGALEEILAKKGVSLESLKATVNQNENTQYEKSWQQATDEFLQGPGADWPGGERNKTILGLTLAALGLEEATDKVGAISKAYAQMKSQNLLVAAETSVETASALAATAAAEKTAADAVAAAKAAADAASAAAAMAATARTKSASSSLFGASSGAGAASAVKTDISNQTFEISPNASPTEIMDAWKKSQIAQGKNPDEAFMTAFSSRRA